MPFKPEGYNTLKQRRFKLAIKRGASSISEAARIAGYSEKTRTVFQPKRIAKTHRLIAEALPSEEEITNDFEFAKSWSRRQKDITNYNRANESLARIRGMYKDKSELKLVSEVRTLILERYAQPVGVSDERSQQLGYSA